MSRLTRYEPKEHSMFPYQLKNDEISTKLDSIHKLGKLEYLMEKYEIEDLVDLEIALNYYYHRFDGIHTERVINNEIHKWRFNESYEFTSWG